MSILIIIILIVCIVQFANLRKQNSKLIKQNKEMITLLEEIKNK
ncbi:hypothetical protein ACFWM3_20445 [Gottfriedia sp. NPDC058432]